MEAPGTRILLVDDDDRVRRALARVLRVNGYDVVEASSIESAEALARSGFDMLVTDLHLGDGTGWELHHRLNTVRPIAAIAISASGSPEDAARSLAAGFCDHLDKPVTFENLRAAIERCARRATG
jgi:CheY-like chemotaxis protein